MRLGLMDPLRGRPERPILPLFEICIELTARRQQVGTWEWSHSKEES